MRNWAPNLAAGWPVNRVVLALGLLAVSCGRLGASPLQTPLESGTAVESPYEPPVSVPEVGITFDQPGDAQALIPAEQALSLATEMFPGFASDATAVYTAFGLFTNSLHGPGSTSPKCRRPHELAKYHRPPADRCCLCGHPGATPSTSSGRSGYAHSLTLQEAMSGGNQRGHR
jgi:hypothetical protein